MHHRHNALTEVKAAFGEVTWALCGNRFIRPEMLQGPDGGSTAIE